MKRYALILALLALPGLLSAQMFISLPIGGVYQTTGSNTSVVLAGQYVGTPLSNYRIEYNVVRLNVDNGSYNSPQQPYATIVTNPAYGLYRVTMDLPVGWYTANVRVYNLSTNSVGSSNAVKFGVGDVYVIAGQSNAQGVGQGGGWSLPSIATYDGILSHNYYGPCNPGLPPYPVMTSLNGYNNIAPSGNNSWYWAKLGQNLQAGSPSGGLPIAFFNASANGSTSLNWKESSDEIPTNNLATSAVWCGSGYTGKPQPYFDFKMTLKYYASIFGSKAMLWHQGESDNDKKYNSLTTRPDYRDRVRDVINKSRTDYSSSFRWLVSEVSFNGLNPTYGVSTTRSDVTLAQNDLTIPNIDGSNGSPTDYSYTGVITDPLGYPYRDIMDLVHFREDRSNALSTVASYWDAKINSPTNGYTKVAATPPPTITMSMTGGNWTLTVPTGYSKYRWLAMTNPNTNSDAIGTGNSLSGSTGSSYACMVMNSAEKWTISQTVYTSCGTCREGIAEVEEWKEEDLGLSMKAYPVPFDKEFTIEFTIPSESMVRLDLINVNGEVLAKIADNVHAKGTYKYPVKGQNLSAGVIFYRLNVNGLAISKKIVKIN